MKILRWVLALLCVGYALMNVLPLGGTIMYKLNPDKAVPADVTRMIPLMEATSWLQIVVWVVGVALILIAAWRLARGGKAFAPYAISFVIGLGHWAFMKMGPVYDRVFTPAELQLDYVIFAVLIAVGAAIWWTERPPRAAPVESSPA